MADGTVTTYGTNYKFPGGVKPELSTRQMR